MDSTQLFTSRSFSKVLVIEHQKIIKVHVLTCHLLHKFVELHLSEVIHEFFQLLHKFVELLLNGVLDNFFQLLHKFVELLSGVLIITKESLIIHHTPNL